MEVYYWILFIVIALASWIASKRVESKFKKYSEVPLRMTGAEVAEKMLRDNDIMDVKVVSTGGFLTDHYNPATKTVNLSESAISWFQCGSGGGGGS